MGHKNMNIPSTGWQLRTGGRMGITAFSLILALSSGVFAEDCERARSRVVQKCVENELLPVYESLEQSLPDTCPLVLTRSRFYQQEEMKYREHPTKFACLICGKTFYEERFIDLHMVNRHDNIEFRGTDAICLADYCDVFRCDVVSGYEKPRYWDKALCKDHNLQEARDRCQMLLDNCVDGSLEEKDKKTLTDLIQTKICGYLTCDSYWDIPRSDLHPVNTAMYVMGFMLLCVGLMVYYYIAYTHFYTDDSLLDSLNDRPGTSPVRYPRVPGYENVRYRSNAR